MQSGRQAADDGDGSARLAQQTRVGRGRRGMSVERREGILVVRLT
jgi:hypothetical protein